MENISNSKKTAGNVSPGGRALKDKEYWLNKLAGEWETTRIPHGLKRGAGKEREFVTAAFDFSDRLSSRLVRLSKGSNPMLYMILTAGLVQLLHKYTGNTDIVVGAPIYKQEFEGKFINTVLALRNRVEPGMTFKELLIQVKQCIIEASEHQNFPVETLAVELGLMPSGGEFPLFDIAVLLENVHDRRYIEHVPTNINFIFHRVGDLVKGVLEYNAQRYDTPVMEQLARHFTSLLQQGVFRVDGAISQLQLLSENERRTLLDEFNETQTDYPRERTIHELFEEQAAKGPDGFAAVGGRQLAVGKERSKSAAANITYKELNEKANQLARVLRQEGVKPDNVVGLMAEPSVEMIIGLLGILKASGAYLPIDPGYPRQRIRSWLRDSGAGILLVDSPGKAFHAWSGQVIDLSHQSLYQGDTANLEPAAKSHHLAYVIYTSGSTGKPKGVLIEHRNILNYACWRIRTYRQTASDISLQLVSFSFDGFGSNFYPSLLSGGTTLLPDPRKWRDAYYIRRIINEEKVTNISLVPSMYRVILENAEPEDFESLRFVVLAGEKAGEELARLSNRIIPGIQLINEYGPTENSVTAAANLNMTVDSTAVIGPPIANNRVLVSDDSLNLKPLGIPGELCIGGDSLARGYLNQPQLTAERFVNYKQIYSYIAKNKIYKTGDLARWLPDGTLEIQGRLDHQEQVRGYRVEPGEIETRLSNHPGIKEAVVMVRKMTGTFGSGDKHNYDVICAYIVPRDQLKMETQEQVQEMRDYLLEYLPDFMIPTYFVELEQMPLTPNGKIDRKALLSMEIQTHVEVEFVAPGNPLEEKLARIWEGFLEKEKIGVKESFFNIGGDSIKSISLLNIINKELNTDLQLADIYEHDTIEKLAIKIGQSGGAGNGKENGADTGDEYSQVLVEFEAVKSKVLRGKQK